MTEFPAELQAFKPSCEFFVGIDSDGCAFDTMELKHKECFIPNIIQYYGLQSVSKYAREAAEFVNLYSEWRGINRFPALTMAVELLKDRPEVQARGVKFKNMETLQKFCDSGVALGNPALEALLAENPDDEDLKLALEWSVAVNDTVAEMVHGVSPYPGVRDCLEAFNGKADMMVVSATPVGALTQEWNEHDLTKYVALIAGQEVGPKKVTLAAAVAAGYPSDKILMIGDAPGDMKAARANNALFFPIVPMEEETSWARLRDEAIAKFFDGTYAGEYETSLVDYFLSKLPSIPPWKS